MTALLAQAIDTTQKLTIPSDVDLTEVSRYWNSGSSISLHWLLLAAGLILLLIGGASARGWWNGRHQRSSPLAVFNRAAVACDVSLSDRLLLWRISRQQGLPGPLTLMLSPTTLRHHARAFAEARGAAGRGALMRRVARLRRELFAE